MSNLLKHALMEFQAAGWIDGNGTYTDEMQESICKHVLKLLEIFSEEGHSGTTAPYTINLFTKLADFKPLVPLTGEEWEWSLLEGYDCEPKWQNKRASNVFKDSDGKTYDINGKVFWDWQGTKEKPYKSRYTNFESKVYVTFPYLPSTQVVYRVSESSQSAPPQTEEGIL